MKIYTFSQLLIIISYINSCLAELHVNEYHFDTYTVHSHDGCHHISNDKAIAHKVPVGKGKRFVKRNAPLSVPFEGTFDCKNGDEAQCNRLREALTNANNLFSSIFDFYVPIKVKLVITNDDKAGFIAQTAIPPYYSLRNPNNSEINAYIAPLVKQLNIDTPIVFNDVNEFDIITTVKDTYLKGRNNIQPTIIHELLHGLGISSNLKLVKNGKIDDLFNTYGGNYYMPKITIIKDDNAGKRSIKGFLPLNMWEKNFVDFADPKKYYFNNKSFNNICELDINYDIHEPQYYYEKIKLEEFSLHLDQWTGMEQGINFYERSHEALSVGFKTNDNRVIPICTYANAEDSDLCHLTSPDIINQNSNEIDGWKGKEDQNFILYPKNVNPELTNEQKIALYGKGKTIGLLSEDIISILETMGYQRKGKPIDDTIYQVQTNIPVDNSVNIVDGDDSSLDDIKTNDNSFAVSNTPVITNVIIMTIVSLIFIQLSFF